MRKLRIYLDTSVINFVFADDAPDFQRATIEFFEQCGDLYDLYISDVVLEEINQDPNPSHREQLLTVIAQYRVNRLPDDEDDQARNLAALYIEKGVVPPAKLEDAFHVAYATIHEMDILLSWNFRHLANVAKEAKILAINMEEGYWHPLRLVSPLEVLHE